jgi:hypothetical protein
MNDPRKVDVVYSKGRWLTQIDDFFHFDCTTLIQLIKAVEDVFPGEPQLFVVDYSTFEYDTTAASQFLHAMERSGALLIASVHEF